MSVGQWASVAIGWLMSRYRASPFHPGLGFALARMLGWVTRWFPNPQVRDIDGFRWELNLSEVIDASLYFSGSFEPLAEEVIAQHVSEGMHVIDVGANIGYHTLRMARAVGNSGRVIAVEPTTRAVTRLRRNLELNGIRNVGVVVAAVADYDKAAADLALQSSYPLSGEKPMEHVRVPVMTLDSLVATSAFERLDFIKIDVDGFEAQVLRGARESLRRFRPVLFFEVTPSSLEAAGESLADMVDSLSTLGYSVHDEAGHPLKDPLAYLRAIPGREGRNLLAKLS